MKRRLACVLADAAATLLVGWLGFALFGSGPILWIVLVSVCAGTIVRGMLSAAIEKGGDR